MTASQLGVVLVSRRFCLRKKKVSRQQKSAYEAAKPPVITVSVSALYDIPQCCFSEMKTSTLQKSSSFI